MVHTRLVNSVRKFQGASRVEPRPGELDVALELEAPPLGVLVQLVEEVVALHVTPLEGAVRYWVRYFITHHCRNQSGTGTGQYFTTHHLRNQSGTGTRAGQYLGHWFRHQLHVLVLLEVPDDASVHNVPYKVQCTV